MVSAASSAPEVDPAPPADLVEVGHVAQAYGLRGGVKIQPYSAQSESLLGTRTWWLAKGTEMRRVEVASAKKHGAAVTATWAGVADREQAQAWKGWAVLVPRSQFPPLAEGEFYWVDLIGCELIGKDAAGQDVVLGTVSEVSDNGAHAILHVACVEPVAPGQPTQPLLDARGKRRETLVPFVQAHIQGVDLDARRIESDWPDTF
ncbi:MAG: ribosome maturation factor RimM [Pigmentiphaga sp.]|uniref:ribosome maturation factor RimM n=1 Tax=Pigmentiphaga sp. TaxID=1977564 RepID=UPI0029A75919|nr:ribosome maturation factor RimM [Pigmentiphaga sp.]MDX3907570.1 ribosome maturation factor RimM [Pigmentiphaga sp.]